MEIKEFIEKFAESVEIEDVDSLNALTEFRSLDEWSSISVMLTIAFFNEEFGKEIGESSIRKCKTIQDLYDLATA